MANLDADIIIIGAGIGGLTAGALLAKKGKRVLILEQSSHAGGELSSFERGDYVFQSTSSVLNGFELGGGHERVLAELNLIVAKQHLDTPWQMILPNHRVNFYAERVALQDELKREFPLQINGIRSFFQQIDEIDNSLFDIYQHKNFIAPYTLKEQYIYFREIKSKLARLSGKGLSCLNQHVHDEEFKKLIDLATYFYSLHPLEECPLLLTAFILSIPKRGVFYFPGGSHALINSLLKSFQADKGQIRYDSRVSKVLMEHHQAVGVQLENGETLRAKDVIANTGMDYLYHNLLGQQDVPGKVRKKLEQIKPQWLPFTVYLGVDETVLPSLMRENVFLWNDYNKPFGDVNNLFINLSPANDQKRAPEGKRAMTVTCFLPYSEWERNADYSARKEAKKKAVIKELTKFIDFLEDGIEYQEAASPLTYQNYTQRHYGALTSLAQTSSGFGFNGFSNHTHYGHLWLVGDDTFPGRGSNLVSISALNLTKLLS